MKLPRNKKEFALFMIIVSIISVNIIAPIVSGFEAGFHLYVWADVLKVMPFLWLTIIAMVLITHKPVQWLKSKIVKQEDSFNAHIVIEVLCTVFLMSMFLTIFGTWIGTRHISLEPIKMFFYKWPRNFAIAFAVELFIAQPIARAVMLKFHQYADRKSTISSSLIEE